MERGEIEKLLGGYATGTLTPDEQRALFEAALEDQALFDELAREQPVRDLLRDPAAKARLLAALDRRPARWYEAWLGWRGAAVAAALAAVVIAGIVIRTRPPRPGIDREEVAVVRQVEPPAQPQTIAPEVSKPQLPAARRAVPRQVAAPAPPPPAPSAAISGAVRDSAGAPVPGATVVAKSLDTDRQTTAKTNSQGEFEFRQLPGAEYALSAQSPGFVPATAPPVTAEAGRVTPVDLTMQVANAADSVEVAAAPAFMARRAPLAAPPPAVKYAIERRERTGDFAETAPEDLNTGDAVRIKLEPNTAGFLRVQARGEGGLRSVFAGPVQPQKSYTTGILQPGDTEVLVEFSRPATVSTARAAYTSSNTAQPTVRITIPLKWK